jgi:hypothetical protein
LLAEEDGEENIARHKREREEWLLQAVIQKKEPK